MKQLWLLWIWSANSFVVAWKRCDFWWIWVVNFCFIYGTITVLNLKSELLYCFTKQTRLSTNLSSVLFMKQWWLVMYLWNKIFHRFTEQMWLWCRSIVDVASVNFSVEKLCHRTVVTVRNFALSDFEWWLHIDGVMFVWESVRSWCFYVLFCDKCFCVHLKKQHVYYTPVANEFSKFVE
jgi:hypothetical protein